MNTWMLLYGVCLHTIWGILLLVCPQDIGATPLALIHVFLKNTTLEGMLYLVASVATGFMLMRRYRPAVGLLLGLPQQFLLLISAGGSLMAVILAQYADGVPRPWIFILADQLPAILAAICHTGALIGFHGGWAWSLSYQRSN